MTIMLRRILILATAITCACAAANARTIEIFGRVTNEITGAGIFGINIFQNNKLLGTTVDGGEYKVSAESDGKLLFESDRFYRNVEVPINGRVEINVEMFPDATHLQEVTVTGKGGRVRQLNMKADLEKNGNWIAIKNGRMPIPKEMYDASSRIIVQPAIFCVNTSELYYMSPKVIDGTKYAITQERMLDWNAGLDTLTPYRNIKAPSEIAAAPGNVVRIHDSIEVRNPNASFLGIAFMTIEDYNRVVYQDTMEFASGTKDPLRLMQYKLHPVYMSDKRYIPLERPEKRTSDGKMNLVFPINGSKLDITMGDNEAEINKMLAELRQFETDPSFKLLGLTISGTASPEGNYEKNQKLANDRLGSALAFVKQNVNPSLLKDDKIKSEAKVAPWEDLAALLREDSKNEEADAVQKILDTYSGTDARGAAIARLPFYRSLIVEEYLPKLRKVEYSLKYEHYRPLTLDETKEAYAENPLGLTRYNYYNLYTNLEGNERIEVLRNAIKADPDFICAITDLSADMLKRGENPRDLMQPLFEHRDVYEKRPHDLRYNMALACLANQEINRADSLIFPLPDLPQYHEAKLYIEALLGVITDETIEEIGKDSPVNGVMLMLKRNDDVNAWKKAKTLGDSAVENYIKALAANRISQMYLNKDDVMADDLLAKAEHYLKRALELNPKLEATAKIDDDMANVLKELKYHEGTNTVGPKDTEETEVSK